jgi:hypothetical protein
MSCHHDPRRPSSRAVLSCGSLSLVLVCLSCLPAAAQSGGPYYAKKWNWQFGAGYSHLTLDPNLPRDLINHENHPDDTPFLTGNPGTTDLQAVTMNVIEIEAGMAFRPAYRSFAVIAEYVLKANSTASGRLERQQINDPRPAAQGSFIYTQLDSAPVSHGIRTGVSAAMLLSPAAGRWIEVQGLVDLARRDMTFEKGWSRFGKDQPALVSTARGFEMSPKLRVALAMGPLAIFGSVTYTQIRFSHDSASLESHQGTGLALGFGAKVIVPGF